RPRLGAGLGDHQLAEVGRLAGTGRRFRDMQAQTAAGFAHLSPPKWMLRRLAAGPAAAGAPSRKARRAGCRCSHQHKPFYGYFFLDFPDGPNIGGIIFPELVISGNKCPNPSTPST